MIDSKAVIAGVLWLIHTGEWRQFVAVVGDKLSLGPATFCRQCGQDFKES